MDTNIVNALTGAASQLNASIPTVLIAGLAIMLALWGFAILKRCLQVASDDLDPDDPNDPRNYGDDFCRFDEHGPEDEEDYAENYQNYS